MKGMEAGGATAGRSWWQGRTAQLLRGTAGAVCLLLCLSDCATAPERIDQIALRHGFVKAIVQGDPFRHLVYHNGIFSNNSSLHVYIEGDGSPWLHGDRVAEDPTPRHPVMLELMAQDTGPALYLGRPCYFAVMDQHCNPLIWTHERYSQAVVSSMAAALRRAQAGAGAASLRLVLIGYSGGGTLATLLAAQMADTCAVVTLAGNLDIHFWAALHHYTPMQGSLNPVDQSPLPAAMQQWHYYGMRDQNVPFQVLARYFARHPQAQPIPVSVNDHYCCWEKLWPSVLQRLARLSCATAS